MTNSMKHISCSDPEPSTEPPEDKYIAAECGHEVYEGEAMYYSDDWGTLCAECLEDKFGELSTSEKAERIGCECVRVCFPARRGW